MRPQFGRNFVSSFLHSSILSYFPSASAPQIESRRTHFVRPLSPVLLLSFSWEEGEMDARCEGLGRRREGVGRKERESQVKNDQRGRCVSVSGKRCIIIPILSPLLLLLLLLLSSLFPPRLTVGLVIIPRDIFSHSCISLTSHQWPSTME